MSKTALKIKGWRKTQKKLLGFIEGKKKATGDEIRAWIADCIVHFTEIKMEQNIVAYFLSKLEYSEKEVVKENFGSVTIPGPVPKDTEISIGPFVFDYENGDGYIIKASHRLNIKTGGRTQMTPILVAFRVAENIISNYEESERLIPLTLINEFNTEKNQGIFIALKSVQNSYEKRNVENMLTPLITATDLVCDLVPEMSRLTNVSKKIKKFYETKSLHSKYNINKEILWALNNARIIRNFDIHNPQKENHTTLYEAVGYSHILVLFINSLLASGKIVLK